MAFPTNPTNGQQTTINGIIYTYDSTLTAWTATTTTGSNISGNNITITNQVSTATIVATGTISAVGNVTGGNLVTLGTATVGAVTSTANISGGNLLISGLISATGNITGSYLSVYNASGNSQIRFGASTNYYWDISRDNDVTGSLWISNYNASGSRTNRVVIDSGGNMGIGTNSPGAKLDVVGTSPTDIFHVSNSTSYFTVGVTANTGAAVNAYQSGVGPLTLQLQTAGGAATFGGSVGIGTNSPATKFQVAGTSGSTQARIGTSANGYLEINAYDASPVYCVIGGQNLTAGVYGTQANVPTIFLTNNTERMRIDTSGYLLPGANATYDLGSAALRWRNIYTSDLHLNNGIGDWTIVEGEDDLFLHNNRNGKVYKFALSEVDPSQSPPKQKAD